MPSPDEARAMLALVRWPNALIAAGGVVAGALWAAGLHAPVRPVALAAGAAAALTALANAFNDYTDRDIDRVAHPDRPLPRGTLMPSTALALAGTGALSGVVLSGLVRPALGLLSVAVVVLMIAYSARIKRHGLPGNLLVAVLASLPFLYGAWAVGRPRSAVALLALAIPLHLAREIAKDLDDAPGDAGRRRTLPLSRGIAAARAAMLVALVIFLAALTAMAWRRPRFAAAALPVAVLSCAAAWRAMHGERGGPLLFKSAMVCALFSLAAAH
jgi:geranylgeranylglycerol-phosphate geranylgeranyltransferase